MIEPTTREKYHHLRENAEAFITTMQTMIAASERDGNEELATKLRVWCLMPWEAVIRDDDSGDLWFTCEDCGEPIKTDDSVSSEDGCYFHRKCIDPTEIVTPEL